MFSGCPLEGPRHMSPAGFAQCIAHPPRMNCVLDMVLLVGLCKSMLCVLKLHRCLELLCSEILFAKSELIDYIVKILGTWK